MINMMYEEEHNTHFFGPQNTQWILYFDQFEPAPRHNMAVKVVFNGFSIRRVSDNLTLLPFLSIHSSSKEEAV